MQKFSSAIKKNRTILAITLIVALLAGLNLLLPEKAQPDKPEQEIETEAALGENDTDADAVVISEFMIKNRAAVRDEDGDFSDWIELSNISQRDISLGGWKLSDKEGEEKWELPDTELSAGERLLIFASGKDRGLHTDFSLSAGEKISLYNKYDYLVSETVCGDTDADVSLILNENGEYEECLYPTPGYPEDEYSLLQSASDVQGPLIINELMCSNLDPSGAEQPENYDWAELKNISDYTINLSEYYISDDNESLDEWQLPEQDLGPGESTVIYCEENPESESSDKTICTAFSLNSSNEQFYLSKNGELQDWVSLRDIPYLCSYGRLEGENGWFYMKNPSPGEDNGGEAFRRVSSKPEVISGDGIIENSKGTRVELRADGDIYYTTDGSVPDENSTLYTGPIEMDSTGIIRAVSLEIDAMPSRVRDVSCIINEGHSLPVLSLVADNREQFNAMYDEGMKGIELPGSLSLYEKDSRFNIPCGIKIHGETSRVLPKKNMSVRFRGAYGQEKLSYDVYGGGVTEFKNFVLRAGQDFYSAILRNEFCQNLALNASDSLISQRSKYCVLYINGVYSGIYALMEKPNEQHYASVAGVSRDSVTVVESEAEYGSGFYENVLDFCRENDMSLKENYDSFCKRVDVDSLIDWLILEGYCGNVDLTYGNLRYCRSTENDGRWRFMFYDLDSTFFSEDNCFDVLSDFALSTRQVSIIVAPLLENEEFCHRFLSRAGELLSTELSPQKALAELNSLAAELAPEVERDYERFGFTLDKWEWNVDFIRNYFNDGGWNELAVQKLCEIFSLDDTERDKYFG